MLMQMSSRKIPGITYPYTIAELLYNHEIIPRIASLEVLQMLSDRVITIP